MATLGVEPGASPPRLSSGLHLYIALPASTSIQSRAKSTCRTKEDIRFTTVCATPSTTDGCFRMILPRQPRRPGPPSSYSELASPAPSL